MDWLTEGQLLAQLPIGRADLLRLEREFPAQMRVLKKGGRYHPDSVTFLGAIAAMVAWGARPDQIKAWYGL